MTLETFIITAVKIGLIFFIIQTAVAYLTYLERRILAFIQMRLGPNVHEDLESVLASAARDLHGKAAALTEPVPPATAAAG